MRGRALSVPLGSLPKARRSIAPLMESRSVGNARQIQKIFYLTIPRKPYRVVHSAFCVAARWVIAF